MCYSWFIFRQQCQILVCFFSTLTCCFLSVYLMAKVTFWNTEKNIISSRSLFTILSNVEMSVCKSADLNNLPVVKQGFAKKITPPPTSTCICIRYHFQNIWPIPLVNWQCNEMDCWLSYRLCKQRHLFVPS